MGAVALAAPPRTATYAELAARGASLRVEVEGLTAERVVVVAPRDVSADLRAALDWRVAAMRAQLAARTRTGLGGTLRAVPDLALPKLPACRWRGEREMYGRRVWVSLEAQRQVPGLCDSCGEENPHETGDCMLCVAARVAALRAEGLLPPAVPAPPRTVWPDVATWRAGLVADLPRAEVASPAPPPTWSCRACGREVVGQRDPDDECGPCEMKRASVLSTARLGGARP